MMLPQKYDRVRYSRSVGNSSLNAKRAGLNNPILNGDLDEPGWLKPVRYRAQLPVVLETASEPILSQFEDLRCTRVAEL
jgi:hypothetical protein